MRKTKNGQILTVSYYWGEKNYKKKEINPVQKSISKLILKQRQLPKRHQVVYSDDKIRFGKLFHDFMSQIVNESDYKKAKLKMKARNDISQEL